MYKLKRDIHFISENSLNMKNVFLDLFHCTSKALYVQNCSAEVLGIISISDFVTSYERSGDTDYCNYNKAYKYICFDENEDVLINNAIELFHKFEIRGSIPIKLNDVSIYGEIIEFSDVDEKNDVEKYIKEFQTYKNACYLKQEFETMKKLLFSQKILVLGSEEQFNKKLSFLLSEHCDVVLIGG